MVDQTPSTRDSRLPVIGLTCSSTEPRASAAAPRFGQNQSYVQAVVRAGGVPLLVPHLLDDDLLSAAYSQLDGLLLPGGEDVDPERYGEERHAKCGRVTPDRDEAELLLACWAISEKKPVLAICRGIQVLNVALGGSLVQDIAAQVPQAGNHTWYPGYPRDLLPHRVEVAPGSRLERICGEGQLAVNSLHHQAIKALAPGLVVTGRAADGVIEAVEVVGHPFALGVQWHPEELAANDPRAQGLFDALVAACRNGSMS